MTIQELAFEMEKIREEKMVSVIEFAKDLGISEGTYRRIIYGRSETLRAKTLRVIHKKLGIPICQLSNLMR